jgi:hypothetical protein
MKKTLFLILMLCFVCTMEQGYCEHHGKKKNKSAHHHCKHDKKTQGIAEQIALLRYELEAMDHGTSKENIEKIGKWIDDLEAKLMAKLQNAQTNLEKQQKILNEGGNEETSEKAEEKIRSSENKIQACQELLKVIEQLKTKLKERTHN